MTILDENNGGYAGVTKEWHKLVLEQGVVKVRKYRALQGSYLVPIKDNNISHKSDIKTKENENTYYEYHLGELWHRYTGYNFKEGITSTFNNLLVNGEPRLLGGRATFTGTQNLTIDGVPLKFGVHYKALSEIFNEEKGPWESYANIFEMADLFKETMNFCVCINSERLSDSEIREKFNMNARVKKMIECIDNFSDYCLSILKKIDLLHETQEFFSSLFVPIILAIKEKDSDFLQLEVTYVGLMNDLYKYTDIPQYSSPRARFLTKKTYKVRLNADEIVLCGSGYVNDIGTLAVANRHGVACFKNTFKKRYQWDERLNTPKYTELELRAKQRYFTTPVGDMDLLDGETTAYYRQGRGRDTSLKTDLREAGLLGEYESKIREFYSFDDVVLW